MTDGPSLSTPVISVGGNFQVNEKVIDPKDGKEKFVTLSFASLLIWAGLKSLEGSRAAFNSQYTVSSNKVGIMQDLNNLMQLVNNFKAKFTDKDGKDTTKMMDLDLSKELAAFMANYPDMLKFTEMTTLNAIPEDEVNKLLKTLETQLAAKKTAKETAYDALSNSEEYYVKYRVGTEPSSDAYKKYVELNNDYTSFEKLVSGLKNTKAEGGVVTLTDDMAKYLKNNPSLGLSGQTYKITKENVNNLITQMQTCQSTLSSENEQQSMRTNQAMNRSSGFLQQLQGLMQTAKEALQAASKAGAA